MAKSKQQTSAAKRREQVREQRQQQNTTSSAQSRRRSARRKQQNSPWLLVGGIVVLVAIVVAGFLYLANQPASTQGSDTAYQTITTLNPSLLSQVGAGSAANALKALPPNTPMPTGPTGKPQFLYIGAEYCPFCAAQRWPMIVALSRFGKFTQPLQGHIANEKGNGPNYSTFTFLKSSYSSQYIDFVSVETQDNNGNTLQTPTDAQKKLFSTYDAPPYTDASAQGSIPFIMVGNKYVSSGSYYQPEALTGSYQDIANQIKDTNSSLSRSVLGSANYLTAAICQTTKDQPANVCNDTAIQQIEQSLPKAALGPANGQVALASAQLDMIARKRG